MHSVPIKLVRLLTQSTGMGRRDAMERIRAGRVRVNGRVEEAATLEVVPGRDDVRLDGRPVRALPALDLVMYKPRATLCTRSDPEGRATVYGLLGPRERRASSVGRLDYNTTGVLLLTTDGELARRLELPATGVPRTYRVKLRGAVTLEVLARWRSGLRIGARRTRPARTRVIARRPSGATLSVTLSEGMNRQIHEMARATGLEVVKIHRERFGPIGLAGLVPGGVRRLDRREVARLRRLAGLD
jgi:23S rRNA pseudouridine2605 synthase